MRFNWRAFVSITLALISLLVLLSGVVLFIAPPGRIANWYGWTVLGIDKGGWERLHVVFSVLFVVLGFFHFLLNYRVLLSFFRRTPWGGWKEGLVGLLITVLLLFSAVKSCFPASAVDSSAESLKDYYETVYVPRVAGGGGSSPAVHAELWTVEELARKFGIKPEVLMECWRRMGFEFSPEDTVGDVAKKNGLSPAELYAKTVKALRKMMRARSYGGSEGGVGRSGNTPSSGGERDTVQQRRGGGGGNGFGGSQRRGGGGEGGGTGNGRMRRGRGG